MGKSSGSSSLFSYQPILCNCKLDDVSVFSSRKGPPRSIRDAPPAHYILKIRPFSKLTKEYNSNVFDAGGYKWNLCLFPKGNKHEKGHHISLYLVMADSNSLALGWEVKASFRFSVFDQSRGKYLTAEVHGRRFNEIKKEWGFDRFISLKTFTKCSNGYLVDDECVFGVEVFDIEDRRTGRGECLLMKSVPVRYSQTWKIPKFSQLGTECCFSPESFIVEGYKWRIILFPEGNAKGNCISLYLELTNLKDHPTGSKVNVNCCLRVRDQIDGRGMHKSHIGSEWFSDRNRYWGFQKFMPLSEFKNPENGFLVNDTCTLEVDVAIIGIVNLFS